SPAGGGRDDGPNGGPLAAAVRGYAVQIRRLDGSVVFSRGEAQFPGEDAAVPQWPKQVALSTHAERGTGDFVDYLTVKAKAGGGRFRARAWSDNEAPCYLLLLAAPLNSVDSTLHRLLLIELLVTAAVLAALAALG